MFIIKRITSLPDFVENAISLAIYFILEVLTVIIASEIVTHNLAGILTSSHIFAYDVTCVICILLAGVVIGIFYLAEQDS